MASRLLNLRHVFNGGWATDFGPTTDVSPQADGKVMVPYLVDAENVFYTLDGGPSKIGGTEQLNASAVASGGVITGLFDFWRQGAAGSPSRKRILHAGTVAMADNNDGVFANIVTGLDSGAIPSYSIFDDLLIISSDSTADVPKSYDGTTAQSLAGSPPRFSFSTTHMGRQWAAGVYTVPSTVYYSVAFDPEDWTGSGSGSIQIDPNDGDMITGLASYKNELWVFKGPNRGSIHRITGSGPSTFAHEVFVKSGLGACWHNAIFQFKDDLGFVSQYGTIHSLKATAAFGDYNEQALSRPIQQWLKTHLNANRLRNISAANNPQDGYVVITISIDSSTTNNVCLMMDYRDWPNGPMRWALWKAYAAGSLNLFVDTNGVRRLLLGGNDGYVRRAMIAARSIDTTTAIAAKVTTPYLNYGDPMKLKTLSRAAVGIAPKGSYDLTFGWTRDDNSQQTEDVSQGGGDVLGPSSVDPFTLGTSELAGSQFVDRYVDLQEGGEFRSIQYQFTQNGLDEDLELHGFSAQVKQGADSTEN